MLNMNMGIIQIYKKIIPIHQKVEKLLCDCFSFKKNIGNSAAMFK